VIRISDGAKNYFRHLLAQQDIDNLGIRIKAVNAGTPKADCVLEYAEAGDLAGDETKIDCDGFNVYIEAASVNWLAEAEVDYQVNATGGQLTIRAPHIKGSVPGEDASLGERVQYVLVEKLNTFICKLTNINIEHFYLKDEDASPKDLSHFSFQITKLIRRIHSQPQRKRHTYPNQIKKLFCVGQL